MSISPLMIRHEETSTSFLSFVTSLLGVAGSVFAVAGLVDRAVEACWPELLKSAPSSTIDSAHEHGVEQERKRTAHVNGNGNGNGNGSGSADSHAYDRDSSSHSAASAHGSKSLHSS